MYGGLFLFMSVYKFKQILKLKKIYALKIRISFVIGEKHKC